MWPQNLDAKKLPFLLFFCYLIVAPVCALSIGFTDNSMAGPQKLEVYSVVNGTHLISTNTSSQFEVLESVIIQITPDRTDYIRNPRAFLDNTVSFVGDNILEIMILCFILGFLVTRR
jgi:hypothetical protein